MPADPIYRSLPGVLQTAALELAELASMADYLEFGEGDLDGRLGDAMITRLQLADLLTQRLAGLTQFVSRLADDAPWTAVLDIAPAVGGLKLADQASRFVGAPMALQVAPDHGEPVLFD